MHSASSTFAKFEPEESSEGRIGVLSYLFEPLGLSYVLEPLGKTCSSTGSCFGARSCGTGCHKNPSSILPTESKDCYKDAYKSLLGLRSSGQLDAYAEDDANEFVLSCSDMTSCTGTASCGKRCNQHPRRDPATLTDAEQFRFSRTCGARGGTCSGTESCGTGCRRFPWVVREFVE